MNNVGASVPNHLPWAWGEPVTVRPSTRTGVPAEPDGCVATRSVATTARPEALFLWLCQLRRAPYSYDWIDNWGRRSLRSADPALQALKVGQTFMTIFTLVAFVPGRSLTLRMKQGWPTRAFGPITVMYSVEHVTGQRSRLSAVLWMPPVGRVLARFRRYWLAWGDVVMMRKQLLVLRALAEHEPAGKPGRVRAPEGRR